MAILYTTEATATGGRDGSSALKDGSFGVKLTVPKALGGPGGEGTNPEQLFALGYSACFLGALRFVAGKEKVTIPADATVSAEIGIGPRDDGTGFGISAAITVAIPGLDRAQAEDLAAKAHVVCPYSHAIKNTIDVKVSVA